MARVERRLEDAEDSIAAALDRDRVDDLAARVEELTLTAVTHDDLLHVRIDAARMAAELTRVRAELQAELDRLSSVVDDLAATGYPRKYATG
jgi:hypothetical protein